VRQSVSIHGSALREWRTSGAASGISLNRTRLARLFFVTGHIGQ